MMPIDNTSSTVCSYSTYQHSDTLSPVYTQQLIHRKSSNERQMWDFNWFYWMNFPCRCHCQHNDKTSADFSDWMQTWTKRTLPGVLLHDPYIVTHVLLSYLHSGELHCKQDVNVTYCSVSSCCACDWRMELPLLVYSQVIQMTGCINKSLAVCGLSSPRLTFNDYETPRRIDYSIALSGNKFRKNGHYFLNLPVLRSETHPVDADITKSKTPVQ